MCTNAYPAEIEPSAAITGATSNEFAALHQPLQKLFDPRQRLRSGIGNRRRRKALTHHARDRERRSRIVIQRAQLHVNQAVQRWRYNRVVTHRLIEHTATVLGEDLSSIDRMGEQVRKEQRVAATAIEEPLRGPLGLRPVTMGVQACETPPPSS